MGNTDNSLLSIKDLSLGYHSSQNLLASVSASAFSGEMIALVGRNGVGKSTLLRTISGIQLAQKGSVFLSDKPIEDYSAGELSSRISFVGTGNRIPENMTVYEMVSLGRHPYTNWWGVLKESDHAKIRESISFVGMMDFINSRVEHLSDGERQRVMIAMALAQDTKIIVLDEPTAFLDIPNRIGIAEVLNKLKQEDKTVIFSTHDFENVFSYADKVWVIHDKKLLEGAPEDLGIANIFNEIFLDSKVNFDRNSMHFVRQKTKQSKVYIHSHTKDNVAYWTGRALERIGYSVQRQHSANILTIKISENKGIIEWIVEDGNTTEVFNSLYDMSGYLKKML